MSRTKSTTSRRGFFRRLAAGSAACLVGPAAARAQRGAQAGVQTPDSSIVRDTTNLFVMDQAAARSVTLPPKTGAPPLLTADQRDELEHHLHCQCGCTLDVFTCRTTDSSCQVSPAMHRDLMGLVNGGYGAQEIIDAFVGVYGERVLMAPKKSGFGLLAWFVPGAVVITGGLAIAILLNRWKTTAGEDRR